MIGRFISADTIVPSPATTQGYNRYTYVYNNPLSYTDPDGHEPFTTIWALTAVFVTAKRTNQDEVAAIAASLMTVAAAPWGAVASTVVGFGAGFAASGGNLKAGVYTAATAAAFSGAGWLSGVTAPVEGASASAIGAHYAGMVVLHGTIGGISSDLQGGSFASGFYAAGLTRAFGPAFESGGLISISSSQARIFAAAVVGGTASELSGGKFSNGARTGAFSRALNDEMHRSEIEKRYGAILKAGNIDLASNADEAAHMSTWDFIDHVRTGGLWDYKTKSEFESFYASLMDEFGNFHFGYVARAHGFTLGQSVAGAGLYQAFRQVGGSKIQALRGAEIMRMTYGGALLPELGSEEYN